MLIKVLKKFMDKENKVIRSVGEEFDVTKKRFEEINSTAFGILAEEVIIELEPKSESVELSMDIEEAKEDIPEKKPRGRSAVKK